MSTSQQRLAPDLANKESSCKKAMNKDTELKQQSDILERERRWLKKGFSGWVVPKTGLEQHFQVVPTIFKQIPAAQSIECNNNKPKLGDLCIILEGLLHELVRP